MTPLGGVERTEKAVNDFSAVDPAAALRGFFAIAALWGLNEKQGIALLGMPSRATYHKWKAGKVGRSLPHDTLARIGYVAGIFKALQILYADAALADRWIRQPNRHFAGKTPLEVMASGDMIELARVRQYLDAARGAWG